MAPEQLDSLAEGGSSHADSRSDLYALGVVLFDCLVREPGRSALPSACRWTMAEELAPHGRVQAQLHFHGCVQLTRTCLRRLRLWSAAVLGSRIRK